MFCDTDGVRWVTVAVVEEEFWGGTELVEGIADLVTIVGVVVHTFKLALDVTVVDVVGGLTNLLNTWAYIFQN